MREKFYAKDPLLYIRQPEIGKPTAPMQDHYHTPKNETNHRDHQVNRTRSRHSFGLFQEDGQEEIETHELEDEYEFMDEREDKYVRDVEEQEQGKHDEQRSSNSKKFKEMTIKEKVDYFINKPKDVPKLNCLLRTNDQTHRGIITAYEDNEVHLQTSRRSSSVEKIPFDQINSIKLVGF